VSHCNAITATYLPQGEEESMRDAAVCGEIWVPIAGAQGGFRYQDSLKALDIPEVVEVYDLALAAIEGFAASSDSDLGMWTGHGPALSVYAQWAVYSLETYRVIDVREAKHRFKHLAELQRAIHYGRSTGWLTPPWWGSEVHAQHQGALIARAPDRYTADVFTRGLFQNEASA
jgi:hypothetical protein